MSCVSHAVQTTAVPSGVARRLDRHEQSATLSNGRESLSSIFVKFLVYVHSLQPLVLNDLLIVLLVVMAASSHLKEIKVH